MRNFSLKEFEHEIDTLHFLKAYEIAQNQEQTLKAENPFSYLLLKGRMMQALYQWKETEKALDAAKEIASEPEQKRLCEIRKVRLYTLTNRMEEAWQLYQELDKDWRSPWNEEFALNGALLCYETGRLEQAFELCQRLEENCLDQVSEKTKTEACVLAGDLLSTLSNMDEAFVWYEKALQHCAGIPLNWRPLRKALIFHNMADVYEQLEDWASAEDLYNQAKISLSHIDDELIYDLPGYSLEILLSIVNFLSLQDRYEDALRLLEKSRKLLPLAPSITLPYWDSRLLYLTGLIHLYQGDAPEEVFPTLFEAWRLQKQFLQLQPAGSKEYLGKLAYYAAYVYQPKWKLEDVNPLSMYEEALQIFEEISWKDPSFYLHTIGSIYNEIGTLMLQEDPDEAEIQYLKALETFESYVQRWPKDQFARSSLISAGINYLSCLPQPDEHLVHKALFSLICHLKILLTSQEDQENASLYIEKLLSLDWLQTLCPLEWKELETLVNPTQTFSA